MTPQSFQNYYFEYKKAPRSEQNLKEQCREIFIHEKKRKEKSFQNRPQSDVITYLPTVKFSESKYEAM